MSPAKYGLNSTLYNAKLLSKIWLTRHPEKMKQMIIYYVYILTIQHIKVKSFLKKGFYPRTLISVPLSCFTPMSFFEIKLWETLKSSSQLTSRVRFHMFQSKQSIKFKSLPCREVSHEEFWDQLLKRNWLIGMPRTHDVFLLHCSQYTVLHVKIIDPCFSSFVIFTFYTISILAVFTGWELNLILLAQGGTERTRGILLYK